MNNLRVRDSAEKKSANFIGRAEFKEVAGMRQGADGGLDFAKARVKPRLQLRHRDVRREFVVEASERQTELGAELVEREFGTICLGQDKIRGLPHSREVIHQRA